MELSGERRCRRCPWEEMRTQNAVEEHKEEDGEDEETAGQARDATGHCGAARHEQVRVSMRRRKSFEKKNRVVVWW